MHSTVILLCFLLNMLDGADVLVISYAAPLIAKDWSLSLEALGAVFSAGLFGMTIGAVALAPLSDSLGRRRMILVALAVISGGVFLTAWADSVQELIALRFCTGLGIGSMLASITSLAAESAPVKQRSLAIALASSGYPMGAALLGIAAAWILPTYGWTGVFLLMGALTVAMLPVCFWLLPESAEFLSSKRSQPTRPKVSALLKEHRGGTILLWTAFFTTFLTLYFLTSWIPKIAVDAGLAIEQAIYAGTCFNLGAFVGVILLGWASERFGLARLIGGFFIAAMVFMVLFGAFRVDAWLVLVEAFSIGFFLQGGFIGLYAVAARLYPTSIRTTGVGWCLGAGRVGAIVGPYVGGVLMGAGVGITGSFVIFAVPLAIAASAVVAIRFVQNVPPEVVQRS